MANVRQSSNEVSTVKRDGRINKSQLSPDLLKDILNSNIEIPPDIGGSVSMAIKKHSICISSEVNKVHIGYDEFNKLRDSLLVFKNGVYQEIDIDYVLNDDNTISKKDGSNWIGTADVKECFNFVCIVSTSKEASVYMSVSKDITVDQWQLNSDGLYVANVIHNLKSEKLIMSAIDAATKKSVFISYRIIDANTVEVISDSNITLQLLMINSEESSIQDKPSESINVISVSKQDWTTENGKFVKIVNHNLGSKDLMIDIYDTDTNKNLILSCELLNNNSFKITSSETYNCKIILVYRSVTSLNPSFKINDNLVSTETTFSSDKIMKLVGGGVPFAAYESFNSILISPDMWILSEGIYTCSISHNLDTRTLLLNAFDKADGRSLLLSYLIQDANTIVLESDNAYECDLIIGYSTKTNPAFKINDGIVSEESTYSSKKIEDIISNGGGSSSKGNMKKINILADQFNLVDGLYEYTINHNMNTEIVSILGTNTQNEQIEFVYKKVDSNNMKIYLAEAETVDIILVGVVSVEEVISSANNVTADDSKGLFTGKDVQLALENIASAANTANTKAEQAFQAGDKVKNDLVGKLISEGLEVSTNETFAQIIDKISLGRQWAGGQAVTTTADSIGRYGATLYVKGLSFKPSLIIAFYANIQTANSNHGYYSSVYCDYNNKKYVLGAGGVNGYSTSSFGTEENSSWYAKDGEFKIPFQGDYTTSGKTVVWYAFE